MKTGEPDWALPLPTPPAAIPERRVVLTHVRAQRLWLALLAAVPLLTLFLFSLLQTRGHFTYTLDDPYIHLALARNIWLGHYGINLSEPSAPSSSILWPFLLAPFSALPACFEYVPLALNVACLYGLLAVTVRMFADLRPGLRPGAAFACAFTANAYGLVFTGMEHSLQLLLVALVLLPHLKTSRVRASDAVLPGWAFAALVALPLVRYEGLALSLPLLALAAWRGQRRAAAAALAAMVVVIAGFSLFLHAHGLGYMPSSILAKTGYSGLAGLADNAWQNLAARPFLFAVALALAAWTWRTDRAWALVIVIVAVCGLHALFGKFGWFGRYEAWLALFVMLNVARARATHRGLALTLFVMPFTCLPLVMCTVLTPVASGNILAQQGQVAQIAGALDEPVAVNDLGLVSLRTKHYVLDLVGLGSIKALRLRLSATNPAWMGELMAQQGVRYAFVYDEWYPQHPASWIRAGRIELTGLRVTGGSAVVSFYAVDAAAAAKLKAVLDGWAAHRQVPNVRLLAG